MSENKSIVPVERIERMIYIFRGQKVMLDSDLAELYGVETKMLIRAVKRNIDRFPDDFMFQLSKDEYLNLRYHFGTSSEWGGRRRPPFVFTEQGVAMLSSVLKSDRAVQVNIEIMRAFVKMRKMLLTHEALMRKINALEKNYDEQFKIVFDALRELMAPLSESRRKIGFRKNRD